MNLILAATQSSLADAWLAAFDGVEGVEVHHGSIFDVAVDALVSPANSFGFMDGGIDALYSERFGWDLQLKLRRRILDRHHGELLIGSAEMVSTGDAKTPYLIAAPTMRVPMVLEPTTINPFLATRAALRLVRHDRFTDGPLQGQPIREHLTTIAFPGMGTDVGRVSPAICARAACPGTCRPRQCR